MPAATPIRARLPRTRRMIIRRMIIMATITITPVITITMTSIAITTISTITPMLMTTSEPAPLDDRSGMTADEGAALYRLMTWLSPAFPVGAFSYSSGIEWAVEVGDITDAETLKSWLGVMLAEGGGYCDAVLFAHAHRAVVSSDDKAAVARAHGCDHTIVYTREDFAERVREITDGEGVPVVYDSVGKATFEGSLRCLRRRGVMASFGESSGDPDPVPPRRLGALGSIYLTHPSVSNYTVTRAELLATANDLFAMVSSGKIKIEISRTYDLHDAPRAHADMEARNTTGSIVLVV